MGLIYWADTSFLSISSLKGIDFPIAISIISNLQNTIKIAILNIELYISLKLLYICNIIHSK